MFHFDVGDGHFVPPVTIGPIVLESIAPPIHERGTRSSPRAGLSWASGIAFNPETEPEDVAEVLGAVDLVLCMSIHPGLSGQALMPETFDRIERLRNLIGDRLIEVDGGVSLQNTRQLYEAGAGLLVAGTAVFEAPDIGAAYRHIQSAAVAAAGAAV